MVLIIYMTVLFDYYDIHDCKFADTTLDCKRRKKKTPKYCHLFLIIYLSLDRYKDMKYILLYFVMIVCKFTELLMGTVNVMNS